MSRLALDYNQRDAFVCHLDGVCVPQLVGRKPPPDAPPHYERDVTSQSPNEGWLSHQRACRTSRSGG